MFADLAEQLLRFHACGSEETINHIVGVLRLAEGGTRSIDPASITVVVDEQAERRREKDRERKRAVRKSTTELAGVSAERKDFSADEVDSSPPPSSPPAPPLITPTLSKKQKPQALPWDWQSNADHRQLAEELGFGEQHLIIEAARMRAWAASKGEMRADWDAFFAYWLRNGSLKAFKSPALSEKILPFSQSKNSTHREKMVFVAEGTPQWEAWVAAGHKRTLKSPVRGTAGWYFLSEWPSEASQAS